METIKAKVDHLVELGFSKRKIVKLLNEQIKLLEDVSVKGEQDKEINKIINAMLFDGDFIIVKPSSALLGLIKKIRLAKGSKQTFDLLTTVKGEYFFSGIYEKSDEEKSNRVMYLIKQKFSNYNFSEDAEIKEHIINEEDV